MSNGARSGPERPRELRRRVKIQARVRATGGWADACILNVSSRGMMINAARPSSIQGNTIELWHGERLVMATVVWRKGTRAGLRSEQRVPVEDILAEGGGPSLQPTALPMRARQQLAASCDGSRLRARIIELAGVLIVSATLAVSGLVMVQQAFARPIQAVQAALGN